MKIQASNKKAFIGNAKKRKLFGRWLEWSGGVIPTAGIPIMGNIRIVNLHSWTLCIVILFLLIIVLIGTSGWKLSSICGGIKNRKIYQVALSIVIGCFLGTGISKWMTHQEVMKQKELAYSQFYAERIYVRSKTKGVVDFLGGRYSIAKDSLERYADTSAVAAYYYGLILYNGFGVEQDQVTGLKYMDLSAQKNYFRAMNTLSFHYSKFGDFENAIQYAENYIEYFPPSFFMFQDEVGKEIKSSHPLLDYLTYENNCYSLLLSYYTVVKPDLNEALYWINKHYEINHKWPELKARDRAWAYWTNGYTWRGKRILRKAIRKYPKFIGLRLDYAKMLLDIPNVDNEINIEKCSLREIQYIEKILIEELKLAAKKDDVKIQQNCALILEKLYRATGYFERAKNMNFLSSDLKLQMIYEESVK